MATSMKCLLPIFGRLSLIQACASSVLRTSLIHTTSGLDFRATTVLGGEPLKKKKRIDPAVLHAREQRKRKRLEKEIKKLSKFSRKFKPIMEFEMDRTLSKQLELRQRVTEPLSNEETEYRALLNKDWSRHKHREHKKEVKAIGRAIVAQEKALEELRKESEELYLQAVTLDDSFVPFVRKGISDTPPIKNYEPPDGEYTDTTKTFE